MRIIKSILVLMMSAFPLLSIAGNAKAKVYTNEGKQKIHKEIYGQFAEHLGTCIYGGLWVGKNSHIPNTEGYRNDVLAALKNLQIPVLRWPGGCFADEYHWMDGIGPSDERPKMQNNNWGGTIEDNSFGTHEFLNLCEMLGCEPYISGNVGSGTVEELAKWVEYMTSDGDTPMANLRRKNGRDKAWKVKYLGIGNESWGCGGNMRPEYYSDLYRRYSTYCRNYDGNKLYKIASGASDYDFNWTKVLMANVGHRMHGLSLHYYTVAGWNGSKGSATVFNADEYYWTLGKCLEIDKVISRHKEIMNQRDPDKRIGLMMDEWGTWWDEEPGTIRGHLYQQNSMRDAIVAALSLNVFHKHTDRLRMANIAQLANVLQSMILTSQEGTGSMVLTPTYHIFEMYKPFQEATYLPVKTECDTLIVRHDMKKPIDTATEKGYRKLPLVSISAARTSSNSIILSLVNVSLDRSQEYEINLDGISEINNVNGRILTCKNITDHNTFENPENIKPKTFNSAKIKQNNVKVDIPAKSVVILEIK